MNSYCVLDTTHRTVGVTMGWTHYDVELDEEPEPMQRPAAPERSGSKSSIAHAHGAAERFELLAVSDSQPPQGASRSEKAATHDDAAISQTPNRGRTRRPASSILPGLLPIAVQVVGDERVRGRMNARLSAHGMAERARRQDGRAGGASLGGIQAKR